MTEEPTAPRDPGSGAPAARTPEPGGAGGTPAAPGGRRFLRRGPDLGALGARLRVGFGPFAHRWTAPFLVGLVIASTTYSIYQVQQDHQEELIYRLVDAEVSRVSGEFSIQVSRRIRALAELAARTERMPDADLERWEEMARTVLDQDLRFRAIAWLDSSYEIRSVVPGSSRLGGLDLDPRDDEERRARLGAMAPYPEATFANTVLLADGRRQILIRAPLFEGSRPIGTVIGVIRLRDLLDELTRPSVLRGFAVAVLEGPYLLFGPVWQDSGPEAGWERDETLQGDGLFWVIQLWPGPELVRRLEARAPAWGLGLGIFLAVVVALGVDRLRARRAQGRSLGAPPGGPPAASA
jgi:sensor domain CHASE-containing protein